MKFCYKCGSKLEEKYLDNEGNIPYCPTCKDYVFPIFSIACSMIVMNKNQDKILLIQQYGRANNILVAGYVNQGENLENTAVREVKEETDLNVIQIEFNYSKYYQPSNTLMVNFVCIVEDEDFTLNVEVDKATWFPKEEALDNILSPSLAKEFLEYYLNNKK